MANSPPGPSPAPGSLAGRILPTASVIIVSSVMFSFISYWRTAAVVLCDLASTAYYIGGIVEQSIGKAAPWFILAVMIFSYAVRSVYIESCSMFIRGGVYRVVREALGRFMAKIAVSALMFDYILTGPISAVSAGQYIMGLGFELYRQISHGNAIEGEKLWTAWGAVLIATGITLYFFRQNLIGIHESSDKAVKIMAVTTIMVVILLVWCGVTLALGDPWGQTPLEEQVTLKDRIPPLEPLIKPRKDPNSGEMQYPMGFLANTQLATEIQNTKGWNWFSLVGLIGIIIAFGHSILAMSGEETLAQVYREVEAPKLLNFRKAGFVVFVYSIVMTAGISFLAVMLIPDGIRMAKYSDNLIGGLAMQVWGPTWAKLLLNAFVVVVGSMILAGAVNTAIIGSNGVLNRVAEDGVVPEWFLRPHRRYGTTYRVLFLILMMQMFTILISQGDVLLLAEAYAFGVVWSFVFQALAMVVLRFKDPRPREAKVPLNIPLGKYEIPVGLILILLILLLSAIFNLLTKHVATVAGLSFTAAFYLVFTISERFHEKKRDNEPHEHLEHFNRENSDTVSLEALSIQKRPYTKLVAIRSVHNLIMLEKALQETDPETTSTIVMTAKVLPIGSEQTDLQELDQYDRELMTGVVSLAERIGKEVKPLIVPTNNPLHAVLATARDLHANELVMGASNVYTADAQMEQIAFYWINLHGGNPRPLTVRILSRERDVYLDLAGGNRIPKISERSARSVAELRAAGVGVDRVMLLHDGTAGSSDLFNAVLTMLDPQVALTLVSVVPPGKDLLSGYNTVQQDKKRAEQLERKMTLMQVTSPDGATIVRQARKDQIDLIILPIPQESPSNPLGHLDDRSQYVATHAHCRVMLTTQPGIPTEVVDETPSR